MKLTLGEKLKDERTKKKLTSKQVCEEIERRYGYKLSVGKYNEMESDADKDFGYRAFIYLSKLFEVSVDYLMGRTDIKSVDKDIQTACKVTGLSETAVNTLEQLNMPLDFDDAEKERILNKQKAFTKSFDNDEFPFAPHLNGEEAEKFEMIIQKVTNQHILSMLNDFLTAPTGKNYETYGMLILNTIYNYCRNDYIDTDIKRNDTAGTVFYKITADNQRNIELLNLHTILMELRIALIGKRAGLLN